MIPDYLIDAAMDKYAEVSGQSVSRPWMRAAMEASAAFLAEYAWDDGYAIGWNDGHNHGDLRSSTDNPYKRNETA